MSKDLDRVARRLKLWRDESGYSLQQLARRSGVAASTIQKVESQQMVPTIAVLLKIAHGLGRRPAEFIDDDSVTAAVIHQTPGDRPAYSDGNHGTIERVGGELTDPTFEVWRIVHQPGGTMGHQSIHFEGEQLLMCESGELSVRVDGERYELTAGDALHFKAELPHSWSNESDQPAQFLIIGTLPSAMRGFFKSAPATQAAQDGQVADTAS
jgi:transcriptional regulator with XRE-family HTH domain